VLTGGRISINKFSSSLKHSQLSKSISLNEHIFEKNPIHQVPILESFPILSLLPASCDLVASRFARPIHPKTVPTSCLANRKHLFNRLKTAYLTQDALDTSRTTAATYRRRKSRDDATAVNYDVKTVSSLFIKIYRLWCVCKQTRDTDKSRANRDDACRNVAQRISDMQ
jgi:hypothetical protein